jgi:hypothetical protein
VNRMMAMLAAILPALGCSNAVSTKPLKVYILAGQPNMEGAASIETFDYIGEALGEDDPRLKLAAAQALGQIGPGSAEAVPALEDATRSGDLRLIVKARDALSKIQRQRVPVGREPGRAS